MKKKKPKVPRLLPEVLPEAVTKQFTDNRYKQPLNNEASSVASWAYTRYELRKTMREPLPAEDLIGGFVSASKQMERAAIRLDAQYFRDLADAIEHYKNGGYKVNDAGLLERPLADPQRAYILENWNRWETEGAKIAYRLAEIKERTGGSLAESKYHAFVDAIFSPDDHSYFTLNKDGSLKPWSALKKPKRNTRTPR